MPSSGSHCNHENDLNCSTHGNVLEQILAIMNAKPKPQTNVNHHKEACPHQAQYRQGLPHQQQQDPYQCYSLSPRCACGNISNHCPNFGPDMRHTQGMPVATGMLESPRMPPTPGIPPASGMPPALGMPPPSGMLPPSGMPPASGILPASGMMSASEIPPPPGMQRTTDLNFYNPHSSYGFGQGPGFGGVTNNHGKVHIPLAQASSFAPPQAPPLPCQFPNIGWTDQQVWLSDMTSTVVLRI